MAQTILQIDASARSQDSVTRMLTAQVVAQHPDASVTARDLAADPLPHLTEDWVAATFTPENLRTEVQRLALALSDTLVAELQVADVIVIGLPIYNFSVPAALKAWIDQVARAGVTFRYTEDGPEGLLSGKKAVIAMASGGVPEGSPVDFATPFLRQFLGFLGISDVTVISADQMNVDPEAGRANASKAIAELTAAA